MRFKATLGHEHVSLLYNLVVPISKLAADHSSSSHNNSTTSGWNWKGGTVVRLDKEHMRLSTKSGGASGNDADGITCFAELVTEGGIFLQHKIESAADNVIVFEIDLVQLRMALQSIVLKGGGHDHYRRQTNDSHVLSSLESSKTVLKLAKRHVGGASGLLPCLCLDANAGAGGVVQVHHAIPIRIMRADDMQHHLPPQINLPDVQLELPVDRPLRTVVERLKAISSHVFLDASMSGELTMRMDSEGSSVRTFFSKLIPRYDDEAPPPPDGPPSKCTLKVDTKKLSTSLLWQSSLLGHTGPPLLCMVENEMLVLHVPLHPTNLGFFTYYVPVHFLSDDEMEL